MQLILASASPARLATLRAAGLAPDVVVSGVDEDAVARAAGPVRVAEVVLLLAAAKARDVAARLPAGTEAVVLGCDSLLELDGRALGKPGSDAVTARRWAELAGRTAALHTGHAVLRVRAGAVTRTAERAASTSVHFGSPTPVELGAYVASGEPQQVAGGFTIDGLGAWFVDGVTGDPHTVVGVSLPLLRELLLELGVGLTDLGWPVPS